MSLTDMLCDGIYVMYGLLDHGYSRKLNLTDLTLSILLRLAAQPSAGYAIMKDVEALSTGRVRLSTGTLYNTLRRLLEQE